MWVYSKLGIRLASRVANDLRLRILGNMEMLENLKFGWRPSFQSPFQKFNLDSSSQKHSKIDIKLFLSCPVLLGCLYFVPDTLLRIVGVKVHVFKTKTVKYQVFNTYRDCRAIL